MDYIITEHTANQAPPEHTEIYIWASRKADEDELQRLIRYYRALGSSVVVYRSGRGDLTALTGDLLAANCPPRSKSTDRADCER